MLLGALLASASLGAAARGAALKLAAIGPDGRTWSTRQLLAHIAPRSRQLAPAPARSGVFVTDLQDSLADGSPWIADSAGQPVIAWSGPSRVRVSFPWPVAGDGFSTVEIDDDGRGYADGDVVELPKAIAETEYRLFEESLRERSSAWEPRFKPDAKTKAAAAAAREALDRARRQKDAGRRSAAYEACLSALAEAWSDMLFEHGAQTAAQARLGRSLRWGLTLDETLASHVADLGQISERVADSGSNWARLLFRMNPEDFTFAHPRSFLEYDDAVAQLEGRKVHVMGSVLDSAQWPRAATAAQVAERARNLVLHYRDRIRSWEIASEPNGDWLGGFQDPLPEDTVLDAVRAAAAQVKRIDPSLETVATLYWWEGTARDPRRALFPWIDRTATGQPFAQVDVVALSIYPDDNPMGLSFGPVFRKLRARFPDKRLMLGGYGYVEGDRLEGYWWFDPDHVDEAREDLVSLYTGAAAAIPGGIGGGFYFPAIETMLSGSPPAESLLAVYRKTVRRLRR